MFFPFYQDRTVVGKSTTSKLIKIKEPPPPALKTSFHLFSAELSVLSLSDTLRITLERVGECLECLEIYFSHTFQETSLGSSVRSTHRQGVFSLAGFLEHKICHHRIGIRPSSPLNTEQRTTTQDGLWTTTTTTREQRDWAIWLLLLLLRYAETSQVDHLKRKGSSFFLCNKCTVEQNQKIICRFEDRVGLIECLDWPNI